MKTITFFNNKGGVGKTSFVYHLAWMLQELGRRVVAVDLDPQSNLTSAFLDDDTLERLWPDGPHHPETILGAIDPMLNYMGDIQHVESMRIAEGLFLIPGDLGLSAFEDRLSLAWSGCLDDKKPVASDAFRVMSAFHRITMNAGRLRDAEIALIDVGPNIGAMNRAALVASDFVVIPLGADLFSLQGLRNLGPTLRAWRSGWEERRKRPTRPETLEVPEGSMTPLGYVLLNPSMRGNRPVKAYARWANRIPEEYQKDVLGQECLISSGHQLAMIKHYKSLMPLAQDARMPMFKLTVAEGAIGGHGAAVQECYDQFRGLALQIMMHCGLAPSGSTNH